LGELGLVNGYKVVGVIAIALALVAIVILTNIAIKNSENSGNMNVTRVDLRSAVRSRVREFFNGWNFVVVEHSDVLAKNLQKVFIDENISASVSRVDILELVNYSSKKPHIVILNLLDREVLDEVNSSRTISTIHRLMLEGSYVLFITNDSNIIRGIAKLFDPPLSYPSSSSSKITITKQYSDGRKELVVADTLFVVGRTYKNIDGRLVPFGVGATILIDNTTTIDEALQRLAREMLESIVAGENNLYRRWG